jgi:ribosomal protein L11 methyltransferase
LLRLAVRVRRDQAELVLAELLDLAPGGVEEVDLDGGVVEYAVYGAPGELPALPDVRAVAGDALLDVSSSEVRDDWEQRWRLFHRPLVLEGRRLSVRPPWEAVLGSEIELVIDPGQAFGTGGHATTRLCLELMLSMPARGPFLDLGCGSGVLAIAAARLGWSPVVAVDFDPLAVEAAEANAAVNEVSIEVRRHDLRSDPVEAAPTMAANLLRPLLLGWAARLGDLARLRELAAGGARFGEIAGGGAHLSEVGAGGARPGAELPDRVIASGLLVGEADEIARAFGSAAGLRESTRRVSGDWAALLLERRP